jgi:hypothetical protein
MSHFVKVGQRTTQQTKFLFLRKMIMEPTQEHLIETTNNVPTNSNRNDTKRGEELGEHSAFYRSYYLIIE